MVTGTLIESKKKTKTDNSPIEGARKSTNLHTTQMSHVVTKPFIGAFRYRDTLKKPSWGLDLDKLD